ncbi:MAG: hypothetical protein II305_00430 [Clostridia bacterium]|nr:hypothetical protein [Clostridia bacterium]
MNEEKIETKMTVEEKLQYERERLIKLLKARTPKSIYNASGETIENAINTLSENDCKAMYEIVKKKGLMGLMMAFAKKKKTLKKEIQNDTELQNAVENAKELMPETMKSKEEILK